MVKGFGFVTLDSPDQVTRVCQKRFHEINGKSVWDSAFVFTALLLGKRNLCLISGCTFTATYSPFNSYSFLSPSSCVSWVLQVEVKKAQPRQATASGMALAQMRQSQQSVSPYGYQGYGG